MPGIYGVYEKKAQTCLESVPGVLLRMENILFHRKDYLKHFVRFDGFGMGKISVPGGTTNWRAVWSDDRLLVLYLDGAIFSYTDESGTYEVDETNCNKKLKRILSEYSHTGSVDTRNLNGEFNLVLYDISNRKLLIANDSWGFRELYYYDSEHLFLFAPEVKAILQCSEVERKIDERGMMDFINYGYLFGDRTLIDSVRLLPPRSTILLDKKGINIRSRSYKYNITLGSDPSNFEDYVDTAYTLLDQAVQRRLRGRKKIAAYLSGGLDSRIVSAMIAKRYDGLDTFSLGNNKCKECSIAKSVSQKMPGTSNRIVQTKAEDIQKYAEWATWISDGMGNMSFIASFFSPIINFIKGHDILLGGFVGDLILGASFTKKGDLNSALPSEVRLARARFSAGAKKIAPFANLLFNKEMAEKICDHAERSVDEEFSKVTVDLDLFPFQFDLFAILTRCRRRYNICRGLFGHVGTEEYYPFFDDDLFNFLYSLPPELRMNHKLYIAIYKKYFPELAAIPWLKTGVSLYDKPRRFAGFMEMIGHHLRWHLKRRTFGRICWPDKNNYTPHNDWYRTNREFRSFIDNLLLDPRTISRGFLHEEGIKFLLHKMRIGLDYFDLVDRLCVFELWCRLFLDGDEKHFSSGYNFHENIFKS